MASKWTAERRAKFRATMRSKKRNGNSAGRNGLMGELRKKRAAHLAAAKKIQKVMSLLSRI